MQKNQRSNAYDCLDNYFNDSTSYSTLNMLGINTDDIDFDKLTDDYIKSNCNAHYNKRTDKQYNKGE